MIIDTLLHAILNFMSHLLHTMLRWTWWVVQHMLSVLHNLFNAMQKVANALSGAADHLRNMLTQLRGNILQYADDLKEHAIQVIDTWTKPVQAYLPGLMWWVRTEFDTVDAWFERKVYEIFQPATSFLVQLDNRIQQWIAPIQEAIAAWELVDHALLPQVCDRLEMMLHSPFPTVEASWSTRRDVIEALKETPDADRESSYSALMLESEKVHEVTWTHVIGPDGTTYELYRSFQDMIDDTELQRQLVRSVRTFLGHPEDPNIEEADRFVAGITHGICTSVVSFNYYVLFLVCHAIAGIMKMMGYEMNWKEFWEEMREFGKCIRRELFEGIEMPTYYPPKDKIDLSKLPTETPRWYEEVEPEFTPPRVG